MRFVTMPIYARARNYRPDEFDYMYEDEYLEDLEDDDEYDQEDEEDDEDGD